MGERKGQNLYYPPDYDPKVGGLNKFKGTHALRERARKLHMGILIIRFEMPYNIWCDGCENHIGMGVRYNAEKKKVGMYYSTPVYQFRMKCHLCNNHFEIKTDPGKLDYEIVSGARRQENRWDPTQNEQVVPEDKVTQRRLFDDAMFKLEHHTEDVDTSKKQNPRLRKLVQRNEDIWRDDFAANSALRRAYRENRKRLSGEHSATNALLKKSSLDIKMLAEHPDDLKVAAALAHKARQEAKRKTKVVKKDIVTARAQRLLNESHSSKMVNVVKPKTSLVCDYACYGIVQVPTGPWYCRKCESPERAARVKCELCPNRDGALKKTDGTGWAHVVCALYIPEVRFGNVTTMEPIILTLIPRERFDKTCYICQEAGRGNRASQGACMQCNKSGCKQQFHVTCAQGLGLLCEEAGNYSDNVKYCGYCQHHYSKLKKGGNVKAIPPYKPVATGEHDSSPEKDGDMNRSSGKKKSYLAVKPTVGISQIKKSDSPTEDHYAMDTSDPGDSAGSTLKFGTTTSHTADAGGETRPNKFTTSNFVETVVTQSEPVFGSDTKTTTSPDSGKGKKRKCSGVGVKPDGEGAQTTTITSTPVSTITSTALPLKNLSVSVTQLKSTAIMSPLKTTVTAAGVSKTVPPTPPVPKGNLAVYGSGTKITIATAREDPKKGKGEGPAPPTPPEKPPLESPTAATATAAAAADPVVVETGKRSRSSSIEKGRKPKRTPNKRPGVVVKDELDSPPGSPGRRNKKQQVKEEKDVKSLPAVSAPHMLGNQLNPASSMAQKMRDSLHQEVEAHSIYTQEPQPVSTLVGPPLPGKFRERVTNDKTATLSAANSLLSLGNAGSGANNPPQTLADLLEQQWARGSQFLMEQAQHFDIASLLTCLHQLKGENTKLEEHVASLTQRRDHLLAVNARLSNPPSAPPPIAPEVSSPEQAGVTVTVSRQPRVENGVGGHGGPDPHPPYGPPMHPRAPPQASPTLRNTAMPNAFANQQRRPVVSSYYPPQQQQQQQPQQMPGNPNMGVRRDDLHQQM